MKSAAFILSFFASAFVLWAGDSDEQPQNKKLPQCTKVEVLHLDPTVLEDATGRAYSRNEGPKDVPSYFIQSERYWCRLLGTKVLEAEEAEAIARLWRGLGPKPPPPLKPGEVTGRTRVSMAACHSPGFAYRFYSGDRLLAESTVCWHCKNFTIHHGAKSSIRSFDTEAQSGTELLKNSNALFQQAPK